MFNMTYQRHKDSYPYKQEDYRHIQKKSKVDKMGKLKRIRIFRQGNSKSENFIAKTTTRSYFNTLQKHSRNKT